MKTVLLWFFVSYGTGSGNQVLSYSPPFATSEECARVQTILNRSNSAPGICVQMNMVVTK